MSKKTVIEKICLSGMFLALCIVLPFFTGQIPDIGKMLSPMHIPVFLCGFFCGHVYGAVTGFLAPLVRFAIFTTPVIFPGGISMAFELAAYGAVVGILHRAFPPKAGFTYLALICAMLSGRVVWGIMRFILAGLSGSTFSFSMFLSIGFLNAVPGIMLHIALVPVIVVSVRAIERRSLSRR